LQCLHQIQALIRLLAVDVRFVLQHQSYVAPLDIFVHLSQPLDNRLAVIGDVLPLGRVEAEYSDVSTFEFMGEVDRMLELLEMFVQILVRPDLPDRRADAGDLYARVAKTLL
jgi:hypothetical protein